MKTTLMLMLAAIAFGCATRDPEMTRVLTGGEYRIAEPYMLTLVTNTPVLKVYPCARMEMQWSNNFGQQWDCWFHVAGEHHLAVCNPDGIALGMVTIASDGTNVFVYVAADPAKAPPSTGYILETDTNGVARLRLLEPRKR